MLDAAAAAAAAALWVIVVWRARMLRGPHVERSLWLALATLACAQVLQVRPVAETVNGLVGTRAGATALSAALVIVSSAHVLSMLDGVTAQLGGTARAHGGRRRFLAACAVVAALSPLAVSWPHSALSLRDYPYYYELSPTGVAMTGAYVAYLTWALLAFTHMCWTYGRASAPGAVRTGLLLGGMGTAVGLLHTADKVLVFVGLVIWGPAAATADDTIQVIITGLSVFLCATGSSYPAITARLVGLRRRFDLLRSLRRLYPLWVALLDATPEIALGPVASRGRDTLLLRDAEWRLVRRVVEIRDGLLAIRPYLPDDASEGPGEVQDDHAAAATAAARLEEARRRKLEGRVAVRAGYAGQHAGGAATRGGDDFASEVRWLERLADAHGLVLKDRRDRLEKA